MNTPSVAIVGFGAVGKALLSLFPNPTAVYDEPQHIYSDDPRLRTHDSDPREMGRDAVNRCDFAFVCVPTPSIENWACDTSIVEEVVGWIDCPIIVIRSTVPPGTTARLREQTGKRIVFQPEYGPGETVGHPYGSLRDVPWVVLGGERADTVAVADLYKTTFNADLAIHQTDATTAELVKYMENAYLATKVAFCNEFYDIASAFGVDYNEARELWLADPRIGRSHTFVYPEARGFGGKCLPKDLAAILAVADTKKLKTPVLNGAWEWAQPVMEWAKQ